MPWQPWNHGTAPRSHRTRLPVHAGSFRPALSTSDTLMIFLLKSLRPGTGERVDIKLDVHGELVRLAEEFGVLELVETEWALLEPRLLGPGS